MRVRARASLHEHVRVGRVVRLGGEVIGLPEEVGDGPVELGERRDAREQPAVAHAALLDVARVDIAPQLQAGHVAHTFAAAGRGRQARLALPAEGVCVPVGGSAEVRKGWELLEKRDDALEATVLRDGRRREALGSLAVQQGVSLLLLGPARHVRLKEDRRVPLRLCLEPCNAWRRRTRTQT